MLSENLHKAHPLNVSPSRRPLHCSWLHRCLGLQESQNQSFPAFLQYPLLAWAGNYGIVCTSGDKRIQTWAIIKIIVNFALQLLVGLFSFLALLACESGTARFRAGLVPIHAIMGTATFIMALATAICGLMERAFLSYRWEIKTTDYRPFWPQWLSTNYTSWLERFDVTLENVLSNVDVSGPLFLNVISGTMGLLAILMPVILWYPKFRFRTQIA